MDAVLKEIYRIFVAVQLQISIIDDLQYFCIPETDWRKTYNHIITRENHLQTWTGYSITPKVVTHIRQEYH